MQKSPIFLTKIEKKKPESCSHSAMNPSSTLQDWVSANAPGQTRAVLRRAALKRESGSRTD